MSIAGENREGIRPSRRDFLGLAALAGMSLVGLSACNGVSGPPSGADAGQAEGPLDDTGEEGASAASPTETSVEQAGELVAQPDPGDSFGVDLNVNMATIDQYLGRADVAYRDMRMLSDPADFAAIGGNADLDRTLEGFRITPFPYMASMPALAVDGAYDGPCLLSVEWGEDNRSVASVAPNYVDAMAILEELFPKHKKLFLMCGGGGYAGMMRALLIYLGWDADKVFNIGGNWDYEGSHGVHLISYDDEGRPAFRRWRADYAMIEFENLAPSGEDPAVFAESLGKLQAPHERGRKCIVS